MTNLKITRGLFFALSKKLLLPDCFDSSGLETAVAGYEREVKVKGSCSDDAVGHVGNNVARNILERVGYTGIHGCDEESRICISEGRPEPLQSGKWKPSP